MIYYWDTPGSNAVFIFFAHFAFSVFLAWFALGYQPKEVRR
ncbi:hypothetical protein IQ22_04731 [Pseudomonas duriflava]|uniref:Uncharacterized protein n=2 Tax=Pseudomonas duriflava TaxID=459528 RepID=A0A562PII3_9PSED|nr:hypothetical protein IQ22_04731 [Pseudomonas duriflava]